MFPVKQNIPKFANSAGKIWNKFWHFTKSFRSKNYCDSSIKIE